MYVGSFFDTDMYFVSDTLKRASKIKDLHITPVPTLSSMATDPFFEIFILCRCFSHSEIIALNQTKPQAYVFTWFFLDAYVQSYSFAQRIFRDGGVKSPAATMLTYKWPLMVFY